MNPPTTREPVDLACESVAGEEDPGASIDLATRPRGVADAAERSPGAADRPAGAPAGPSSERSAPVRPGDEAPEGIAGTGENVCPACGGSGRLQGTICAGCAGTGKVTVGIGGA